MKRNEMECIYYYIRIKLNNTSIERTGLSWKTWIKKDKLEELAIVLKNFICSTNNTIIYIGINAFYYIMEQNETEQSGMECILENILLNINNWTF